MNVMQISHRLIPRQLGLLVGTLCIIALFSILQVVSSLMLSVLVSDAQRNEGRNQLALLQQVKVDEARVTLLSTSNLLNRAGIYFMQDTAIGSDGGWRSLMEEAYRALAQSKTAWDAWRDMKSQSDPDLIESYRRLYSGIKEWANGLMQSGSTDAFLVVPVQAFQTDSNGNYVYFQQGSGRYAEVGRQQLLTSLERPQNLFLFIPLILAVIVPLVWRSMFHWVIMPLRRLIDHIDILAAGDFPRPAPQVSQFNREVMQLNSCIVAIQQGLCTLVRQMNDTTTAMVGDINEPAQSNKQLYQQSVKQSEELSTAASHIPILETYVEDSSGFAELTNQCAAQACDIAVGGDRTMVTVNASMQAIVTCSPEMRGITMLINNIAFQTSILALNAAIEVAHIGEQGYGFAVVVKEVGLLTRKSGQPTQNIQILIKHLLQGIEEGFHTASGLDKNSQRVTALVENLGALLNNTSTAMLNQGNSIHRLTRQLHVLNGEAQQISDLANVASDSSLQLHHEPDQLMQAVARLRPPA